MFQKQLKTNRILGIYCSYREQPKVLRLKSLTLSWPNSWILRINKYKVLKQTKSKIKISQLIRKEKSEFQKCFRALSDHWANPCSKLTKAIQWRLLKIYLVTMISRRELISLYEFTLGIKGLFKKDFWSICSPHAFIDSAKSKNHKGTFLESGRT